MTIKYTYQRDGTTYWQRKVPKDVASRYTSSGTLKINLHTLEPALIASKVARLNRQHEAQWEAMRNDPTMPPQSTRDAAKNLLKSHGIVAVHEASDLAISLFTDTLDEKRIAFAERQLDPEEAYHSAPMTDYLSKHEIEAVHMVSGRTLFKFTDALEVYLKEHRKAGQDGFSSVEEDSRRCAAKLISHLGDKELTAYTREDAKSFRDHLLASGLKTSSVRRNITPIAAIFALAMTEKQIDSMNVWNGLQIQGLGKDSTKRPSVAHDQLETLRELCKEKDDDIRWAVALQADTGSRLAEVIGLALSDIHITGTPIPYVEFTPHPWRTLKNNQSIRKVPLVGASLWAAERVIATAAKGQIVAFPRYVSASNGKEANSDGASATINKWLRASGLAFTTHSFRHAMRDRLRNANAQKSIQDEVGGWGERSMGDNYGEGTRLLTLHGWLLRSMHTAHGAPLPADATEEAPEG